MLSLAVNRFTTVRAWVLMSLLAASSCAGARAQATAPAPVPTGVEALDLSGNPDAKADRFYSQIWMESSPEYSALCQQAFNSALLHVQAQVDQAPEVEGRPAGASGLPMAVAADLDETILDNSGYQRQLVLSGKEFTPASWNAWVQQQTGVKLTPGAKAFIDAVESMGVTMVYISNRPDQYRDSTIETLRRLGLNVDGLDDPADPRLQLRQNTSDKGPRRRRAAESFEIIAFLGDNIEDFPALHGPSVDSRDSRRTGVDQYSEMWGTRWFVFPNPIYGSWTRPLRRQSPRDFLEKLPR